MFSLRTALLWVIMQQVVVISYRCFRTTCPIFKSQESEKDPKDFWHLKMGPTGCAKTLVRNNHCLLHNNPEVFSSHVLWGGSLKLRVFSLFIQHFMKCLLLSSFQKTMHYYHKVIYIVFLYTLE